MKKLISLLMVLALMTGLLAGCGNEAGSSVVEVQESSVSQAPQAEPVEEEPEVASVETAETEETVESLQEEAEVPYEAVDIRVGTIKGPTGVGMVKLMEDAAQGTAANNYEFTLAADASEVVTKVIAGEYDIACVPTNSAAVMYQKTQGNVKLLALNTAGVLHILQNTANSEKITDWSQLKGKTIYSVGQGANPEYVLDYVLSGNGIDPDNDVNIVFCTAADEVIAACASGEADFCMLPEPAKTTLLAKVEGFEAVFDMTEAWDQVVDGASILTQGCVVVQTSFLEEHPEAVEKFLEEYAASVDFVTNNADEAVSLIVAHEIVPSEGVAKAALPGCHVMFMAGQEMKDSIAGYYQVLFDADPTSLGGAIPDDDFYVIMD